VNENQAAELLELLQTLNATASDLLVVGIGLVVCCGIAFGWWAWSRLVAVLFGRGWF
jgi:hypothetical protein